MQLLQHCLRGTYTVTVTDNSGCTVTASASITQPTTPLAAFFCGITNVTCHGSNNGSAQGMASGGTSPYSYKWSNGETNVTPTDFSAGTYTVTVTDAHGCTATAAVTITQPNALTVATTQTNVTTHLGTNGSATATPSGGTAPYTYKWGSNCGSKTTATVSGLSAGTYTVTVTDNHGCTATAGVNITQPLHEKTEGSGDTTTTPTTVNITVYPNPTAGEFHVEGTNQGQTVQIYDFAGRLLKSNITDNNSSIMMNLSDQPNGIYLIRVIGQDGAIISQKKLVKQW